jgi:hypothetical protein
MGALNKRFIIVKGIKLGRVIASVYRNPPPLRSGLNVENSVFGYTKTALIESGLFWYLCKS